MPTGPGSRPTFSCSHPGKTGLALVVRDVDALTPARSKVVDIETAHHPSIQMQADRSSSIVRYAADVNVVPIGHKARHFAASQQEGPSADKLDVLIVTAITL